jgi:acyl phosphate:glycerol-3-phosphate acyltransferase
MNAHSVLISAAAGYVLGSIPFGYLLVRAFHGADVRTTGSGNIGATNVARTSPLLGIATLFLDALKGLLAVVVVWVIFPHARPLAFTAAFAAICGHIFPVWLGFRGGKGVATGLGSFLLLTPKAILIAIGIFLALAVAFRWIALASVVATASLPFAAWLSGESRQPGGAALDMPGHPIMVTPLLWLLAGSLLIILKHHSNISRLFAGTEPRFQLRRQ